MGSQKPIFESQEICSLLQERLQAMSLDCNFRSLSVEKQTTSEEVERKSRSSVFALSQRCTASTYQRYDQNSTSPDENVAQRRTDIGEP